MTITEKDYDILIVGSGGAGLRAALAAKEKNENSNILLVTKGRLGRLSVTALACSDRMAFHATLPHTEPDTSDNWKYHASDIYDIGGRVSDYDLAAIQAKDSAEAFDYLDKLGVPFAKDEEGKAIQFLTDGSDYKRACYTGPKTAVHIEEALVRKFNELEIPFMENHMLFHIQVENNKVVGAWLCNRQNEITYIKCNSVILATGGGGKIYKQNVFPAGAAGDAYAMALEAGASLVNMELIQIGISCVKTDLACSGSLMRAVPRFVNDKGEAFLDKYMPDGFTISDIINTVYEKGASWPVTSELKSSLVDLAVYRELLKGNRVFMDYSTNPEGFTFNSLTPANREIYLNEPGIRDCKHQVQRDENPLERLKEINPQSIAWFLERNINIAGGDNIEVKSGIQHYQGGVKIRKKGETGVEGLFASGECAGGQHGANRPGGNALLDCQVFGKITAEAAVEYVDRIKKADGSFPQELPLLAISADNIAEVKKLKKQVQDIMFRKASLIRTNVGMEQGLRELNSVEKVLNKLSSDNVSVEEEQGELYEYYETLFILKTAQTILQSAILRTESRGPHLFFNDESQIEPEKRKKEFEKYIVVRKENGALSVDFEIPVQTFEGQLQNVKTSHD